MHEINAEPPGPDAILVNITAARLCRSDLSVATGVRVWPMPIVPGHEVAGTVVDVGADVTEFAADDHVVLVYQPACGACDHFTLQFSSQECWNYFQATSIALP